jgi:hypothetical protein
MYPTLMVKPMLTPRPFLLGAGDMSIHVLFFKVGDKLLISRFPAILGNWEIRVHVFGS